MHVSADQSTRRLVQDFVTTPLALPAVVAHLDGHPSPLPALMWAAAPVAVGGAGGPIGELQVMRTRQRSDGWSAALGWPDGCLGLPAFDGELVVHPLSIERSWIGLEGVLSLVISSQLSDQELRDAQVQLRRLLENLSGVLVSATS